MGDVDLDEIRMAVRQELAQRPPAAASATPFVSLLVKLLVPTVVLIGAIAVSQQKVNANETELLALKVKYEKLSSDHFDLVRRVDQLGHHNDAAMKQRDSIERRIGDQEIRFENFKARLAEIKGMLAGAGGRGP